MMMRKTRWSIMDQAEFLQCIGELLERGYGLSEAVESSIYYLPSNKQEEIKACIGSLKGGDSFCENLIRLEFNKEIISYVYFAEKHGGFATAFQDASAMVRSKQDTLMRIKKILYYPLFLIVFTFMLFFFAHSILLPKFNTIFLSMDLKKNVFLVIIQTIGNLIPVFVGIIFTLFILLSMYYFISFKKQDNWLKTNQLSRIPFIGKYISFYYTHIISLQLSYLLSSGFSIYESLQFFQQNKQQPIFLEIGSIVIQRLRKGVRLEESFLAFTFLEREFFRILQHGQDNGRLDQELHFFSNHCMNRFEEGVEKTIKVIQPCLYSFVGILIISIYLAVLLPMFQLLEGF
jgi:competence protein ComGB